MIGENMKVAKPKKRDKADKNPHGWKRRWVHESVEDNEGIADFASGYMDFLNTSRTEREAVEYFESLLLAHGFRDLSRDPTPTLEPGCGFYMVNRGREMIVGVAGEESPENGFNVIATHLDSPRLDLKPLPLDGDPDTGLGLLRTHYYGGIKKYQWVNIPLSLRGRVVKGDGEIIDLGRLDDSIFTIPDLLVHLYKKTQAKRKLSDGIRGEELVALTYSGKLADEDQRRSPVVGQVLDHLHERYGIVEEDLISSDLCLVPAYEPREVGLDRGLLGAYGHDNRVSAFTSNIPLVDMVDEGKIPRKWCFTLNLDKEEIGSEGQTGAKSAFLEKSAYNMLEAGDGTTRRRDLIRSFGRSYAISLDVKSARNPLFKGVQDSTNSARLGCGITITKYTGSGGKRGANDASAEMSGEIRRLYNSGDIVWQMQETGKVDQGGGGTVAKFLATRNMDVIDNGIPLLSMHSPFEIISKTDLWMVYKAMGKFLGDFRSS